MTVESSYGQLTQFSNARGRSRSKLINTYRLTATLIFTFLEESQIVNTVLTVIFSIDP